MQYDNELTHVIDAANTQPASELEVVEAERTQEIYFAFKFRGSGTRLGKK